MCVRVVRLRHDRVVGTLGARQHDAVDQHLILLRLAAEDRVILENEAASVRARLLKLVGCDEARESAAHDNQVI